MANENFSFDDRLNNTRYVSSFFKTKEEPHEEKFNKIKEAMEQEEDGGSGIATATFTENTVEETPVEEKKINLSALESLNFDTEEEEEVSDTTEELNESVESSIQDEVEEEHKSINFEDLDNVIPDIDFEDQPVSKEEVPEACATVTESNHNNIMEAFNSSENSTEPLTEEAEVNVEQKFVKEDEVEALIDKAIENNLIIKSGNYYVIKDKEENRMHGRSEVTNFLCENSNEYFELKQRLESIDDLVYGVAGQGMSFNNLNKHVNKLIEENSESSKIDQNTILSDLNSSVYGEVMQYVCDQTVKNLLETYKSEMYTEKYTTNLFQKYLDREIDYTNPMFKELIEECISKEVTDPYLGELTNKVLTYIKGGN